MVSIAMNIRSYVPGKDILLQVFAAQGKKKNLASLSMPEREDYCARKIQVG